ncbi:heat shock cognate 70 kDa protein-like protein [Tanacetum coccineum]
MHKKDIDDVVIVGGSTRVPKIQQILRDFFDGKALCKSINADEAIAYGAAVWAANLCGYGNKKVKDLIILDVTPRSLGVNVYGDFTQVMIPRNTLIPTIKKGTYETSYDNQKSLQIAVYQGNSSETKENTFLDSIILNHIPAAPAGEQKVRVFFKIDVNGILNVSAELISTGNKKSMQIEGLKGLRIEEKKIIRFEDSPDNWFKKLIQKILKEGSNQVCNNKKFK